VAIGTDVYLNERRVWAMQKTHGFLIGSFYLMIVIFCVLLLATSQFRSSTGSAFDTWRLNYDSNRLSTPIHERALDDLRKKSSTNRDALNFTNQCLTLFDNASGKLKVGIDLEAQKELTAVRSGHKKYDDMVFGDAKCIFRGLTNLHYDQVFYINTDDDLKQDILKAQKLLGADEDQYNDLVKGHQVFLAFKEMERSWYTKLIVDTPYDLLVLFLVTSMGTLGGIIRILRTYGDPDQSNPPLKDYFLVPMIGAVVSIGGYILAKTGLLLLSSSKDETSLSPFMIGLVGIISGLLAKEVVNRISVFGHDILKEKNEG
jgi:hypothetical protein